MDFEIKKLNEEDLVILEKSWGVLEPFEKRLNSMLKNESSFFIVWQNKKPIGHGRIWWENVPIIEDMHIDENLRSKGIGTRLLNYLEDEIKKRDFSEIKLFVEIENKLAEKLYLKKGYVFNGNIVDEEKELIKKL